MAVSFSEVPSNEFSYRGLTKLTVSAGRKGDESNQMIGIKVYQRFNYCLGGVGHRRSSETDRCE